MPKNHCSNPGCGYSEESKFKIEPFFCSGECKAQYTILQESVEKIAKDYNNLLTAVGKL